MRGNKVVFICRANCSVEQPLYSTQHVSEIYSQPQPPRQNCSSSYEFRESSAQTYAAINLNQTSLHPAGEAQVRRVDKLRGWPMARGSAAAALVSFRSSSFWTPSPGILKGKVILKGNIGIMIMKGPSWLFPVAVEFLVFSLLSLYSVG